MARLVTVSVVVFIWAAAFWFGARASADCTNGCTTQTGVGINYLVPVVLGPCGVISSCWDQVCYAQENISGRCVQCYTNGTVQNLVNPMPSEGCYIFSSSVPSCVCTYTKSPSGACGL
jgi:hypothetical protein